MSERGKLMRKYTSLLAFALVILLLLCMGACRKDNRDDTSVGTQMTDTEETVSKSEDTQQTTPQLSEIPLELYSVEIKQETIDNGEYTASLIYPQITGYSDAELEEKVNALIYSYVKKRMELSLIEAGAVSGEDSDIVYGISSFDVTYKGDKLISALCRGSVSSDNSAYSRNFAYGINVDIKGARHISFDSIVAYGEFENAFSSGEFKLTNGYKRLLEETNCADIISQYNPLYSIYPEFYVKDTTEGVNLGVIVDTVHIYSDVAEFECAAHGNKYIKDYFTELTNDVALIK